MISLLAVIAFGAAQPGCSIVERDRDVRYPEDVARLFVEAVQRADFSAAESYWRPGDADNIRANSGLPFDEFCRQQYAADTFTASRASSDKGSIMVTIEGNLNGRSFRRATYLRLHQGRWKLAMDPFVKSSPSP